MQVDRFDPTPLYQQVACSIREQIQAGALKPRDPIPSESDLVSNHGVARETARRAVALLRDEGWVVTLPQRGTFVADRPGRKGDA
ncbi:winged helix-turn-helix domain-containing protein [Streptomonospora salina]|uniref:DNA-binding GntR family transcriptional regulator n=1 Tax=Streptomonospora salina TaxID=104205 RepID=A0A841E8S7_9ACTN|nr:winged helix-turn-helix domain-containing protein [Streptomonospora salina]MBB5997719.1 DNA-binding GntR family transcriptional regulator [Streptomonospora salina]